jgi:hypothetical protein
MAQNRLNNQLYFVECDPRSMHLTKYIEPPLNPSIVKTLEPAYLDFKNSGLMISISSCSFILLWSNLKVENFSIY